MLIFQDYRNPSFSTVCWQIEGDICHKIRNQPDKSVFTVITLKIGTGLIILKVDGSFAQCVTKLLIE